MKVNIIGARGNIGSALEGLLPDLGHETVHLFGSKDKVTREMLDDADISIIATPLKSALGIISEFSQYCTLLELSSVKEPLRKFTGEVISTHPLFGPASMGGAFRTVLFVNDISPAGSLGIVEDLFNGYDVLSITAGEHDRAMASLLVAPYLLSMVSSRMLPHEFGFTTPSFRRMENLAMAAPMENNDVLLDTIRENPYSREVMGLLERSVTEVRRGAL